jgi:hypothetical protein
MEEQNNYALDIILRRRMVGGIDDRRQGTGSWHGPSADERCNGNRASGDRDADIPALWFSRARLGGPHELLR